MDIVKWVHVVFLFTLNLGLSSGHRILSEKDQGVYEPDNFGFQLGGTWSVPFLGNIGGSLGFGSDSSGNFVPQFGFSGGGSTGGSDGQPGFSLGGSGSFGEGVDGQPGFSLGGSGSFGGGNDGHSGFNLGGSGSFAGGNDGRSGFSLGGSGSFAGGNDGRSGFNLGGSGSFGGGNDGRSGFNWGGSGSFGNGHPGFNLGGGGFGGGANGNPGFGGGGGGFSLGTGGGSSGGFESANIGSSGCNCESRRSDGMFIPADDGSDSGGGTSTNTWLGKGPNLGNDGRDGDNNDQKNIKIVESLTCRPINCPEHGDCGGSGGLQYWCDVPGFGVYPFACPGGLDKLGRSSQCIPLACPPSAACQYGYLGPHSLFWINDHSSLENGAGKSQKENKNHDAGHN
ncbi:uncharacterized protein LOC126685603 [Mercurialis annua]|uniref:uncharacterized protein LOC126685603 n=1 Tax=Mercurialis annua TaxID=3986 RepID=UPI0024AFB05B|nr:uncharacterized protein LOC126685603 [Mercurialis annua]